MNKLESCNDTHNIASPDKSKSLIVIGYFSPKKAMGKTKRNKLSSYIITHLTQWGLKGTWYKRSTK